MLKSSQITIKPLLKKHLELLRKLRNDESTAHYLTSVLPINEYMQEEWFKKQSLDDTKMYFAIEEDNDNFIGVVRCDEWDKINRSIRIGLDIIPQKRRQGFAKEAYKLLFSYFFENLGINRIWLLVADYNKIAISLYESLGFVHEGGARQALYRKNEFHDYFMMSILKKEYEKKYKKKK